MFSFLYSEEKKMRHNAANWLEVADRVYKFRRDLLTAAQTQRLNGAVSEVKLRLKEKADASRIKMALESLEGVLRDVGGRIYPASSMAENVEFLLVAAIVILGLRAFFVQPFKIPTNSMWPTYYGMTSEVFPAGEEPGPLTRMARFAALGASNYTIKAPADGEVMIPVSASMDSLQLAYSEKTGRSMLIFPTTLREYTLGVGKDLVRFTVPAEWAPSQGSGYESVVRKSFFNGKPIELNRPLQTALREGSNPESSTMLVRQGDQVVETRVYWVPSGKMVKRGDTIMSFDILTGDMLFVDRLTYNFFAPEVGQGFVFRTENIHSPYMSAYGRQISQYYIKRLVGLPGDTLQVKAPVLWRNGKPIEGAAAFQKNAVREGKYPGYANQQSLVEGSTVVVEPHSFFAMGDNSPLSADSRYWGFVPEKDVVGRPLFIYYPLTGRWGPAR